MSEYDKVLTQAIKAECKVLDALNMVLSNLLEELKK